MGDRVEGKRTGQVREQQGDQVNVQEQAVVEEQRKAGDRQGAAAAVLPGEQTDRIGQVSAEQGTGARVGSIDGAAGHRRLFFLEEWGSDSAR